jgi:hypothetical protein
VSEQRLESSEIAVLGGGEEPSCQLVALFSCRLEARPTLLDVTSGAGGELAHVVLAIDSQLRTTDGLEIRFADSGGGRRERRY